MSSKDKNFVLWDTHAEKHFKIFHGFTFGRVNGDLTFPSDALLSKSHAKLHMNKLGFFIEDLGSTNKTRVNGKEIRAQVQVKLVENDIIQMGVQKFIVHLAPGSEPEFIVEELPVELEGEMEEAMEGAMEPIGEEFEEQTPEEVVTSFTHVQNWPWSTRGLAAIVLFFSLISMWPAAQVPGCDRNLAIGLPNQTLMIEALCTLIVALVVVIIHYLATRFKSDLVGGAVMVFLSISFYVLTSKINEPQTVYEQTNAQICSCSKCPNTPDGLTRSCDVWVRGTHLSGVIPFSGLPSATQKHLSGVLKSCIR